MAQKRKASSFAQEMERDDTAESSTGFSLGVIDAEVETKMRMPAISTQEGTQTVEALSTIPTPTQAPRMQTATDATEDTTLPPSPSRRKISPSSTSTLVRWR